MPQHTDMTTSTVHCKPALPVCPACGGLECLCRPRFFCGQILTDEDLNRLEHYIIEKNKLHNRYLHGWGVACGMEVSCHPCEGFVTVKAGYALSPCGNDIVVCRDEAVNICELLRKCRDDMQRHWECDPAWPAPQPDCDQDQEWVLYICYEEKPSRGITALRGSSAPACCSSCSCGGSSGCGCGCHDQRGQQMKSGYRPVQKRAALPQCEPTITCEGYDFQIRKAPKRQETPDLGRLVNRVTNCVRELAEIKARVTPQSTVADLKEVREDLLFFLERHGISKCDEFKALLKPFHVEDVGVAVAQVNDLIRSALQECLCAALLPPCPDFVHDDCVPIATVNANMAGGCRILRICNWKNRRMVPTVPSLQYWFEGMLRRPGVAEELAILCCNPADQRLSPLIDRPDAPNSAAIFEYLKQLFRPFIPFI